MQRPTRHALTLLIGLSALLILAACGEPQTPPTATTYDLEVAVGGTGSGTVTSDDGGISVTSGSTTTTFDAGTTVTLTATADEGSTFSRWEGDCTGTGTCQVTLDGNASVTAIFGVATPGTATLTVATSGNGTGNVTSDPAGIDLDEGVDTLEVDVGTPVTLTATADDGFFFNGWSGGGCSGTDTCVVEVNADVTVTAIFSDSPVVPVTAEFTIVQQSDDAEEYLSDFTNPGGFERGGTQTSSTDIDLTYDTQWGVNVAVGLRFADVDLPSNAVVTSATITFTRWTAAGSPGSVTLDFVGHASDDAPTFVSGTANFDITTRDATNAAVAWNWVGSWTTETATSPDLSTIVNEVLQRGGWASGNALAFIITSDDSDAANYRRAISYRTDPALAPRLSITYYVPAGG